jgi:hypothetical protein
MRSIVQEEEQQQQQHYHEVDTKAVKRVLNFFGFSKNQICVSDVLAAIANNPTLSLEDQTYILQEYNWSTSTFAGWKTAKHVTSALQKMAHTSKFELTIKRVMRNSIRTHVYTICE